MKRYDKSRYSKILMRLCENENLRNIVSRKSTLVLQGSQVSLKITYSPDYLNSVIIFVLYNNKEENTVGSGYLSKIQVNSKIIEKRYITSEIKNLIDEEIRKEVGREVM